MPTEYIADDDLKQTVSDFLYGKDSAVQFPELDSIRSAEVSVPVCACIKTNKDGEEVALTGDVVKLKTVPVEVVPFTKFPFILVVDRYRFNMITEKREMLALIHRALVGIEGELGEVGWKWKSRKPDFVEYSVNLKRFGAYNDHVRSVNEVMEQAAKRFVDATRKAMGSPPPEEAPAATRSRSRGKRSQAEAA